MATEQPLLESELEELSTFVIPITHKNLVLPNITIAEIIDFTIPEPLDDMPTWFVGYIDWRMQTIPLVSFEALNDEPFQSSMQSASIAVINGLTDNSRLPFYAILTKGTPRIMRITPEEISADNQADAGPAELMVVTSNGEISSIPHVEFIENSIIELL